MPPAFQDPEANNTTEPLDLTGLRAFTPRAPADVSAEPPGEEAGLRQGPESLPLAAWQGLVNRLGF